jgi:hypothetical protein
MIIAVEFDGTIVENKYPEIGNEICGSFYILKELQNRGNTIILSTSREGDELRDAVDYCEKQKLVFDAINTHSGDKKQPTAPDQKKKKLAADFYIDFRNSDEKPDWIKIFWKLHPDEYNYVKLKRPVKKNSFLKRIFGNQ